MISLIFLDSREVKRANSLNHIIFVGLFCASLGTGLKYLEMTRNTLKWACHKNSFFKDGNDHFPDFIIFGLIPNNQR